MALINPFPQAFWFSIGEDQYLMYLLKGYEIEYDSKWNSMDFFLDGRLHREDGPAVIWSNGFEEYWLNGSLYSKETYYKKLKNGTY